MTATLTATATEVLPHGAHRNEWLAWRKHGLGGSDMAAVLGMSRWDSPRDIWLDKTGRVSTDKDSWPIRRGNALEGPLLDWFRNMTRIGYTRTGLWQRADEPWMLGTPDAFTDDGGVAECKTTSWHLRDEWVDGSADYAVLQGQWYLAVTGRSHLWTVAAVGDDDPVIERIERDDALIDTMIDAGRKFWFGHVQADVEPPLMWLDRDTIAAQFPAVTEPDPVTGDAMLDSWVVSRQALAAQIKILEQQKAEAEAHIIAALGEHDHLLIGGQIAATRKAQTSMVLDRDALAARLAELGESLDDYKTGRETRVLRIPDPAKRKDYK